MCSGIGRAVGAIAPFVIYEVYEYNVWMVFLIFSVVKFVTFAMYLSFPIDRNNKDLDSEENSFVKENEISEENKLKNN